MWPQLAANVSGHGAHMGVRTMEKPVMQVTLAQRAAPLLITTMLVAAPVWAQTAGSQTGPATTPTCGDHHPDRAERDERAVRYQPESRAA